MNWCPHMRIRVLNCRSLALIALVVVRLLLGTLFAEDLTRRPATVIRLKAETVANYQFQMVYLRIEEKARTRNARPFDVGLDTNACKIVFISPSGHRRAAPRVALKPDMRVLVSGNLGISYSVATEILIPESN